MDAPKQLQDKIAQFQNLQNQLQMIAMQKQQMMLRTQDTKQALEELDKVGKEKIYRMAGSLLIETTKKDSKKQLGEETDTLDTHIKVLEKQEQKITQKLQELGKELQSITGQNGG